MKTNISKILSALVAVSLLFGAREASAQQQNVPTIEIGMLSVTHLLFTSDLTYVNLASPSVIRAKVVDSSKNMLALQAVSEFPFVTTVSALEANGTMHTFYVRYNASPSSLLIDTRVQVQASQSQVNTQIRPENVQQGTINVTAPPQAEQQQAQPAQQPSQQQAEQKAKKDTKKSRKDKDAKPSQSPAIGVNVVSTETSNFGRSNAPTIEEVMRKERNLYHITDKCFGMEADCINVYAYSDLLYIVISLSNRSDIGYDAGDAQFTVESKKSSAKMLTTDKSVWPKSSYGMLACAPNSMTKIGYTIPKLTLQKNEVMKIYIYEKDGTRNLFLVLSPEDINYAVSPI